MNVNQSCASFVPKHPQSRTVCRGLRGTFICATSAFICVSKALCQHHSLNSNAPDAEVLDLEEVVDAVLGAFAPEAGLLHAAEGCDFVGDDAGVDADDPGLEGLGDAPHAPDVARIEV